MMKDKNSVVIDVRAPEGLGDGSVPGFKMVNYFDSSFQSKIAQLDKKWTSYVALHTFATLADQMEIPITASSQMLGHGRISTTQIYLAGLKSNILDNYKERILGLD